MLHLTRIEGKPTPFEMCSHFQIGTLRCIDVSALKVALKARQFFMTFRQNASSGFCNIMFYWHTQISKLQSHMFAISGWKKLWIFDISNLTPSSLSAKLYHSSLSVKWLFAQIVYQTMVKIWQLSLSAKSLQPTWNNCLHSKIFAANLECNRCTFILQCAFVL